jgi:hypothetical protein
MRPLGEVGPAIRTGAGARTLRYVLALAVAGCSTIKSDILRLEPAPRPETSPAEVLVLAAEPAEPYTVIALITVREDPFFFRRSVEALRDRLRREAARLGGHAVLLDAASLWTENESRRLGAKVIVFEEAARPR